MQSLILLPLLFIAVLCFIGFLLITGTDTILFFIGIIYNIFARPKDFLKISPYSSVKEKFVVHFLPVLGLILLGLAILKLWGMIHG